MFSMQRSILSARFEQLVLEAFDVFLTLAEHVGTFMDEQKTRRRRRLAKGAHGQKEVRFLRSPAHAIHTALDGGTTPLLIKREGLHMILQQDRAVREKLTEHIAEFVKLKFVGVERIGSGGPSRCCVVCLIRRRNQKDATGAEQAAGFGQ